jgi:peptide/nickel transport system ATP-binding protein
MSETMLDVQDLNVSFPSRHGATHSVRHASFSLGRERLGIVGESGSGKSTMGRAILGLTPQPGIASARKMTFDGENLLARTEADWQRLRGRRITMIMQDPKYSLNPVMKIGHQIGETCRLHLGSTAADAERRTLAMLDAVKLRDPDRIFNLYPHELSGGMGQRAMIAMMLVAEPDLLIADEPTSALDVTVQNDVLNILDDLVRDRGMGLIFISHNLAVVSSFCDRILVVYGGKIMEECKASELSRAKHPYTKALIAAAPSLDVACAELATVVRDPAWLK